MRTATSTVPRIESTLQSLSVQGLPLSLNEFGVGAGGTSATVSTILTDSLRLMFGSANATGFYMWGFQAENGGSNLFQPAAALYSVNTSDWNTMALTDAGKAWQDQLGIQDWDSNPNNGWSTHLNAANGNAPTVNPDGTIQFNGYYGAYKLTIGGKSYDLNFTKGTPNYSILVNAVPGDFNFDGVLNNADMQAMLGALQDINSFKSANNLSDSNLLAIGDLNGDHAVDGADIPVMLNRLVAGNSPAGVPEPSAIWHLLISATFLARRSLNRRRRLPSAIVTSIPSCQAKLTTSVPFWRRIFGRASKPLGASVLAPPAPTREEAIAGFPYR